MSSRCHFYPSLELPAAHDAFIKLSEIVVGLTLRLHELFRSVVTVSRRIPDQSAGCASREKQGEFSSRYFYDPGRERFPRLTSPALGSHVTGLSGASIKSKVESPGHRDQSAHEYDLPVIRMLQRGQLVVCYYGFRYYMPETGRWLSTDPIGEDGGLNLYAYMVNDPMNGWDPDGAMPVWLADAIIGFDQNGGRQAMEAASGIGSHVSFGLSEKFADSYADALGLEKNNRCSDWFKGGEIAGAIGETLATGGAGLLKGMAKRKLKGLSKTARKSLESADRKALDKALKGKVGDGLDAHHRGPLSGHSGTGTPAMFPTIGLPSGLKNSRFNGKLLSPKAHREAHRAPKNGNDEQGKWV